MNVASLVLGIVGAVLASLSLGWQAAYYVLTGGRIKVVLRVGGRSHGGMITMPTERDSVGAWQNHESRLLNCMFRPCSVRGGKAMKDDGNQSAERT
jgi:hypothetical protein